jgi:hypothetical protein
MFTIQYEHGLAGREFEVVVQRGVGPYATEKTCHRLLVVDLQWLVR